MNTQSNFKFLLTVSLLLSFGFGATVGYFVPHRHFKHGGPVPCSQLNTRLVSRPAPKSHDYYIAAGSIHETTSACSHTEVISWSPSLSDYRCRS